MEIIKLDPNQKGKASQVLSAAFFDYPMFTFYFPDPKKRSRNLGWYLGNVLNCALRYGDVYTTPEISGVAFTLPAGSYSNDLMGIYPKWILLGPL